jgi:hypothetical protein
VNLCAFQHSPNRHHWSQATLLILKERIHLKAGRFDPLGALLIAVGMAGLTAGLSFGQEQGWTSPLILTLLLLGLLALVTLPFVEQRVWQEDCRPRPHPISSAFPLLGVRNCSRCLLHT